MRLIIEQTPAGGGEQEILQCKKPDASEPSAATDCYRDLSEHDWFLIEQAANGCVSFISDEWPQLCAAIQKVRGKPLGERKSAQWLWGFCEGVTNQSGRSSKR